MTRFIFTVEKTTTGYSAYAEKYPVITVGSNMKELKHNMLDAINSYLELVDKPLAKASQIVIELDIPQLFKYYPEMNAKGISKRAKVNETLLSQYVKGKKKPSAKQSEKILNAIKEFGQELMSLELA